MEQLRLETAYIVPGGTDRPLDQDGFPIPPSDAEHVDLILSGESDEALPDALRSMVHWRLPDHPDTEPILDEQGREDAHVQYLRRRWVSEPNSTYKYEAFRIARFLEYVRRTRKERQDAALE